MNTSAIIHSKKAINHTGFGRKAGGLLFLQENGFNVPPFYLLGQETLQQLQSDKNILPAFVRQWTTDNMIRPESTWAVRSSTGIEDGADSSYAGQFKTIINTPADHIADAILEVIDSYSKTAPGDQCGVIIQQMLSPDYSGVVFTRDPLKASAATIINIIPGLGEALVSGKHQACIIEYAGGNYFYPNQETKFYGEIFDNHTVTIERSIDQIKNDITPFLDQLIEGCLRIHKLRGYPVDIEFAIAGNKLYWLQERPISTIQSSTPTTVWDNSNIGENYPGITLPLTTSFVRQGYAEAYSGMAAFLGMRKKTIAANQHLFDTMIGEINGGLYYNITAWQQLAWHLPFGKWTSRHITKILEIEDAGFVKPETKTSIWGHFRLFFNLVVSFIQFKKHKRKFERTYEQTLKEFDALPLATMSHQQMAETYRQMKAKLGANWIAPVLNGFFCFILFSWLKKIVRHSRLQQQHPNFINDILYAQGDIVSVKIVRSFQQLTESIRANDSLISLFSKHPPAFIYEKLAAEHIAFKRDIDNYIASYGERCEKGELKIETVNYKENPLLFIEHLQTILTTGSRITTSPPDNYQTVIQTAYKRNPLKRIFLMQLIKQTLRRIRDRENYRFYRTRSFDMIRRLCRSIDNWLVAHHHIDNAGDSLYLTIDEIMDTGNINSYRQIITGRKNKYNTYQPALRANRYEQTGDKMIVVEKKKSPGSKGHIKGSGCCSGRITGNVMIITPGIVPEKPPGGHILVANYFEPGSIHLFAHASGIISEKGNLLSHTAILCREMGIPSIIGARDILSVVKDGDRVQMDGSTGEIILLPTEI